jgi:hypothetical protein
MAKGNAPGPFFEEHGGVGDGTTIPTIARETSFGASQERMLRNAQRLGIQIQPPRLAIIQAILHPKGAQLLELFLKNVFRSFQQHVRLPSHQYVPFRGMSIDQFGTATIAAGGVSAVATFQVPDGHRGVIVGFGHDVDNAAAWNDLTWSLRTDGNRYKEPYIALTDQIGTVLNPWRFSVIHIPPGRSVALWAINGGLVQYTARGRLIGWYYPIRRYADGYAETLQE